MNQEGLLVLELAQSARPILDFARNNVAWRLEAYRQAKGLPAVFLEICAVWFE